MTSKFAEIVPRPHLQGNSVVSQFENSPLPPVARENFGLAFAGVVSVAGRARFCPDIDSAGPRPYIIPDQATQFGVAP